MYGVTSKVFQAKFFCTWKAVRAQCHHPVNALRHFTARHLIWLRPVADTNKVKNSIPSLPSLAFQMHALKIHFRWPRIYRQTKVNIKYHIPKAANHAAVELRSGSEGSACSKCTCYTNGYGILLSQWIQKQNKKKIPLGIIHFIYYVS